MSEDFEEQLRLEKEEEKKTETGEGTYTDSDGAVFEWDPTRKAWFPKIDEDFIARYQMNYGIVPAEGSTEKTDEDESAEATSNKEYEDYWHNYYNYYNHYQQAKGSTSKQGGGDAKTAKPEQEIDYTSDAYWEYYKYYYGNEEGEENQQAEGEGDAAGEKDESKAEGSKTEETKMEESKTEEAAGQKRKALDGWFEHDGEKTQHVYVSGLPNDITDDEFSELMAKCGLIMYDPFNNKPKLKLYKDSEGKPKGDGLCCYIKSESVDLALQILDGYYIRDHMISVEKAKFELKGQFDPKKKKKLNNRQKKKLREKQEKLFAWLPDTPEPTTRKKHERTVILKNMFDSKEFDFNPAGIVELQDEVRTEALKFGVVNKATVHDRHPDGVITLIFKNAEDADKCIAAFNGRWFAKKKIIAETWDGKTKYHIEESEEEKNKRLKQWEVFLEKGEAANPSMDTAESPASPDNITSVSGQVSTTEAANPSKDTAASPDNITSVSGRVSTTEAAQMDTAASIASPDNITSVSGRVSTTEAANPSKDTAASPASPDNITSVSGRVSTTEAANPSKDTAASPASPDNITSVSGQVSTTEAANPSKDTAASPASPDNITSVSGQVSTTEAANPSKDTAASPASPDNITSVSGRVSTTEAAQMDTAACGSVAGGEVQNERVHVNNSSPGHADAAGPEENSGDSGKTEDISDVVKSEDTLLTSSDLSSVTEVHSLTTSAKNIPSANTDSKDELNGSQSSGP